MRFGPINEGGYRVSPLETMTISNYALVGVLRLLSQCSASWKSMFLGGPKVMMFKQGLLHLTNYILASMMGIGNQPTDFVP